MTGSQEERRLKKKYAGQGQTFLRTNLPASPGGEFHSDSGDAKLQLEQAQFWLTRYNYPFQAAMPEEIEAQLRKLAPPHVSLSL